MTKDTREHPVLEALRYVAEMFEDAPHGGLPGQAYTKALTAIPALEALLAERDRLRAALTSIADRLQAEWGPANDSLVRENNAWSDEASFECYVAIERALAGES